MVRCSSTPSCSSRMLDSFWTPSGSDMSINLSVYVSPYKPIVSQTASWDNARQATWPASSVSLLTGEREAVLIDALITVAEAERLAEWISAKKKMLTTVYITHGH